MARRFRGFQSDTEDYFLRVKSAGGSIDFNVQREIELFVRKLKELGIRDTKGLDHKIRHCSIYPTLTKAGSDHNLWFMNGKTTHYKQSADAIYTYSVDKGITIIGDVHFDTDILSSLFDSSDFSLGYFLPSIVETDGEIGGFSGTFPNDTRIFSHPQYTATRGIYFDVGSDSATRRVSGVLSAVAGDKDNRGLTICSKKADVMIIQNKNYVVAEQAGKPVSPALPTGYMEFHPGYSATQQYDIAGYWWGKAIDKTKFNSLVFAWNKLQTSISSKRDPASIIFITPDKIAGLKVWLDASDSARVIREPGTQNITAWNDKSGNGKNVVAATGNSVPYVNGNTISFGSFNVNFKSSNGGLHFGCIAVVFTPYVTITYNANGGSYLVQSDTATVSAGLRFGSVTSFLENELITAFYNNSANERAAYTSTSDSFQANTRYLIIFNRKSSNDIDIFINKSAKLTTSYYNSPPIITNNNYSIGGAFTNSSYFNGGIHSVLSYQDGLSVQDVANLQNYLVNKWSIT